MSEALYILYNEVKGHPATLNKICREILTNERGFDVFNGWNIFDHAIRNEDCLLSTTLAENDIDPVYFFNHGYIYNYGEKEIKMMYYIFSRYTKKGKTPISYCRDDHDAIKHIMKTGKSCRREIVEDILSMREEILNDEKIIELVVKIDKEELDNYYHLNDEINLFALKECPGSVMVGDFDLNYEDQDGNNALMIACEYNQVRIIEEILEEDFSPIAKNSKGSCALFHACQYSNLDAFKALVEVKERRGKKKVNQMLIDHRDDDGVSALRIACKYRNKEIIEYLLENCTEDKRRYVIDELNRCNDLPIIMDNNYAYHNDSFQRALKFGAYFINQEYPYDFYIIDKFDKESKQLIEDLRRNDRVDMDSKIRFEYWSKADGKVITDDKECLGTLESDEDLETLKQKVKNMEEELCMFDGPCY